MRVIKKMLEPDRYDLIQCMLFINFRVNRRLSSLGFLLPQSMSALKNVSIVVRKVA